MCIHYTKFNHYICKRIFDWKSVNISIIYKKQKKLLVMISLDMPTFRLVVAIVAEFDYLIILIHNTLLGEITISSTRTTRINSTCISQHAKIKLH